MAAGIARSSRRREIAQLRAQLEALHSRLARLEGAPAPIGQIETNGNGHTAADPSHSRRDLLKLAGAAAAGAAGSMLLSSVPAAATEGLPLVMGNNTTNDASTTTAIFPTASATPTPAPLFQATGQGVASTTTVPPNPSSSAPVSQTIPLIGAIGPGGSLPPIGSPAVNDYPGYAPIQGVGGVLTDPQFGDVHSEGINGFGSGLTGIGITGESDTGYGVVGGSGGIDLAALGNGRIMMAPTSSALLTNAPAGPPNYRPNDFELVRDINGLLWSSLPNAQWIPIQFGGMNQTVFSAVSALQYSLTGSDGHTWQDMDPNTLKLSITPLFDCIALLMAGADLWTAVAGLNQDIAITLDGTVVAWKESGGFAGTFSPNAAFVHGIVALSKGSTHLLKLQWKTNKPAASTASIFAGAGPINGAYSPTRLTAVLLTNA